LCNAYGCADILKEFGGHLLVEKDYLPPEEYAPPLNRSGGKYVSSSPADRETCCPFTQPYGEPEGAALTRKTIDAHFTVIHHFHQLLADGKPEPRAAIVAGREASTCWNG